MPTFIEYHEAADRFRAQSRRLAEAAGRSRTAAHAILGPLAEQHRRHIDELRGHLVDASGALDHLANRCDHRAAVCLAYAHALENWKRLALLERVSTPRPVPPAPWADA